MLKKALFFAGLLGLLCTCLPEIYAGNADTNKTKNMILFEQDFADNVLQVKGSLARISATIDAAIDGLTAFSKGELHNLDPQVGDTKCQIRAIIFCELITSKLLSSEHIASIKSNLLRMRDAVKDLQTTDDEIKRLEKIKSTKLSLSEIIKNKINDHSIFANINENSETIKLFAAAYRLEQSINTFSTSQRNDLPLPPGLSRQSANKLKSAMEHFLADEASNAHIANLLEKQSSCVVDQSILKSASVRIIETLINAEQTLPHETSAQLLEEARTGIAAIDQEGTGNGGREFTKTLETVVKNTKACIKKYNTEYDKKNEHDRFKSNHTFLVGLEAIFNNACHDGIPIILQQYLTCNDATCKKVQFIRSIFVPEGDNQHKRYVTKNNYASLDAGTPVLVVEDDEIVHDETTKKRKLFEICSDHEHDNVVIKNRMTSLDPLALVFQNALGHEADISRTEQRRISQETVGLTFCTTHIYATTLKYILGNNNLI